MHPLFNQCRFIYPGLNNVSLVTNEYHFHNKAYRTNRKTRIGTHMDNKNKSM